MFSLEFVESVKKEQEEQNTVTHVAPSRLMELLADKSEHRYLCLSSHLISNCSRKCVKNKVYLE